jgi:hypothetical protein
MALLADQLGARGGGFTDLASRCQAITKNADIKDIGRLRQLHQSARIVIASDERGDRPRPEERRFTTCSRAKYGGVRLCAALRRGDQDAVATGLGAREDVA